jgi:hypothetical protein
MELLLVSATVNQSISGCAFRNYSPLITRIFAILLAGGTIDNGVSSSSPPHPIEKKRVQSAEWNEGVGVFRVAF